MFGIGLRTWTLDMDLDCDNYLPSVLLEQGGVLHHLNYAQLWWNIFNFRIF